MVGGRRGLDVVRTRRRGNLFTAFSFVSPTAESIDRHLQNPNVTSASKSVGLKCQSIFRHSDVVIFCRGQLITELVRRNLLPLKTSASREGAEDVELGNHVEA